VSMILPTKRMNGGVPIVMALSALSRWKRVFVCILCAFVVAIVDHVSMFSTIIASSRYCIIDRGVVFLCSRKQIASGFAR
jgi:hypothetical protein